jgi:hypothetical protein
LYDECPPKTLVLWTVENEAYERMLKGDVKYHFSIDMASLKEGK